MLELVRSTKQIKLDGATYDLKPITKFLALKHENIVKEAGSDTEALLKIYSDLLNDLGLPTSVVETLEINHFQEIAKYLFANEKK